MRAKKTPKEDWVIFKNTQEAIVSEEMWNKVQELRKTVRRTDTVGEANPFTGLLYCADCGAKMYNHRGGAGRARNWKVVSLDGHRISIRNIELKNNYDHKKVVVPGKTLQEISKIIPGGVDDDVIIYLSDNHIVFDFDTTTVVSRLIEGEYFKIDHNYS